MKRAMQNFSANGMEPKIIIFAKFQDNIFSQLIFFRVYMTNMTTFKDKMILREGTFKHTLTENMRWCNGCESRCLCLLDGIIHKLFQTKTISTYPNLTLPSL